MTIAQGETLEDIEFSWYSQKVAPTIDHPEVDDMKREYWLEVVGPEEGTLEGQADLELRWLRSRTGVTSDQYSDMWREALVGEGLPPQETIAQNKVVYYKNVP